MEGCHNCGLHNACRNPLKEAFSVRTSYDDFVLFNCPDDCVRREHVVSLLPNRRIVDFKPKVYCISTPNLKSDDFISRQLQNFSNNQLGEPWVSDNV